MSFLWRMVVLMIATLSPLISATAEPLPRSVLILDQSNSAAPFPAALIAAFRSTLNPDARDPIAAYTEYLDFTRFAGPGYERLLHTYILEKYHGRPIGVIVVTGAAAFEFALRLRSDLGADIPLVFAMVDNGAASLVDLPPDVTGTTVQFSFCDAVIAARVLVPNIKRIALVGDPLASQSYYGHFKEEIPSCSGELELIDLTGLPMTELKKRVAILPEDAAIVYTTIYAAAAGAGFLASDALAMIAEVANRPIVISQENFLGHGGAGGFVVSAQPIGQEAGAAGVTHLPRGKRVEYSYHSGRFQTCIRLARAATVGYQQGQASAGKRGSLSSTQSMESIPLAVHRRHRCSAHPGHAHLRVAPRAFGPSARAGRD